MVSSQVLRPNASIPGQGIDVGKTVLYRDTWGIPHIYAPTVEAGLYAEGYAQAQDRPVQLLRNLKIAMGEFAEISGEDAIPQDLLSAGTESLVSVRFQATNAST